MVDFYAVMLTVFDSSLPDSMMRRQSGIISVVRRKLITSCSSVLTKAPESKGRKSLAFRLNYFTVQSLKGLDILFKEA